MATTHPKYLYRAYANESGVWYYRFKIIRSTPCGYWIESGINDKAADGSTILREAYPGKESFPKWVHKDGRFASKTKELALDRLFYRAKSHLKHCIYRRKQAEQKFTTVLMEQGYEGGDAAQAVQNTISKALRSLELSGF